MVKTSLWFVFDETHMILVCSETQNNMENMRNKWYEIVGNTPNNIPIFDENSHTIL